MRGIIVADKGFPLKNMQEELDKNAELHYLLPLKRDSKLIRNHDALAWDGTIHFGDRALLCHHDRWEEISLFFQGHTHTGPGRRTWDLSKTPSGRSPLTGKGI